MKNAALNSYIIACLQGKEFFNTCFRARKCHCGEVFGFNVAKAIAFVESEGAEDALRHYTFGRNSLAAMV